MEHLEAILIIQAGVHDDQDHGVAVKVVRIYQILNVFWKNNWIC